MLGHSDILTESRPVGADDPSSRISARSLVTESCPNPFLLGSLAALLEVHLSLDRQGFAQEPTAFAHNLRVAKTEIAKMREYLDRLEQNLDHVMAGL